MAELPVLWSFRRCPYAMRARLALRCAGVKVELREIVLREKPQAFLADSASATVPALRLSDRVIDESLDIMIWALQSNDPDRLLQMPEVGWDIIATNDGPFKEALDHTKYASRYPDLDAGAERQKAAAFLHELEARIGGQPWLFGFHPTIADYAILPFIRQFANTDWDWFAAQDWPQLRASLLRLTQSGLFASVMHKYVPWSEGDPAIWF